MYTNGSSKPASTVGRVCEGLMEKNVSGPHGVTAAQPSEQMHNGPAGGPLPQQRPPAPEETQL